jgi:hypothetical protein
MVDHIVNYTKIKHEADCPTPSSDPYWHKLHEIADNINMKYTPEEGIRPPEIWNDWRHKMTADELEKMELGYKFTADLTHVVKNPVPLQPAKTENIATYNTFLISPAQVYVFLKVLGRGYTFCDRFHVEQLWILTQHQQPGAMDEPDPVKRLKMFNVKLQIKGRVQILKSLNFAKGTILGQVEAQGRESH